MDIIKKAFGIICILLAPAAVVLMFMQAIDKTYAVEGIARTNTALQWGIILFIFIPICAGLVIFGYYALKGEYKDLPSSSKDL